MTNVLTFPARLKSTITAAELALIQNHYSVMATNLKQMRHRLVDINKQLEASRLEIAASIACSAKSLDFDEPDGQSEPREQGAG